MDTNAEDKNTSRAVSRLWRLVAIVVAVFVARRARLVVVPDRSRLRTRD